MIDPVADGERVDQLVVALRASPSRTALLFDFDGTLAPIVDDPAAARPRVGVPDRLEVLAGTYARVAVISGRPLAFLARHLGPGVALSGLYGLESRVDGESHQDPEATRWRAVVAESAAAASRFLAGLGDAATGASVEDKDLSLTLHVRRAPQIAEEVRSWAEEVAAEVGLEVRSAKASVELHPPVRADKGTAVRSLVGSSSTVAFFGDDLGDLPAFAALDDLGGRGIRTWKVAVASAELPAEVAAAADLVIADEQVTVVVDRLAG